jgi:nucleoside-diphosphate-sugar epimerase
MTMRVLVTGSEGRIGRYLAGVLDGQGYSLRGFDTRADVQADGGPIDDRQVGDLRDLHVVRSAMRGVQAVVHLGAIPSDHDDGAAVMQTNVLGTWNVLQAAQENGVRRVVFFSSINAQGSVLTGRPPCRSAGRRRLSAPAPDTLPVVQAPGRGNLPQLFGAPRGDHPLLAADLGDAARRLHPRRLWRRPLSRRPAA